MGKIDQKLTTMSQALKTLEDSIKLFHEYEGIVTANPIHKNEQLFLGMRDSMIQRFKYCTDLLWKVIKVYLEGVEKIVLSTYSPRGVIREIVKVRTISESEGKESIAMIKNRNLTSHIYHEEIAENIAHNIPEFYRLMRAIIARIREKLSENTDG